LLIDVRLPPGINSVPDNLGEHSTNWQDYGCANHQNRNPVLEQQFQQGIPRVHD
jgi:hypothetical protein